MAEEQYRRAAELDPGYAQIDVELKELNIARRNIEKRQEALRTITA